MRAFIAFDLPDRIKSEIQSISQTLRQLNLNKSIKWVEPKNLHVTLKFLGDTEPKKIDSLTEKIKKQLHPITPFRVSFSKIGAFPNQNKPNVIWVDLFPKDRLSMIYNTIEEICISAGFKADQKPFKTHITIARLKRSTRSAHVQQISKWIRNTPPVPSTEFLITGISIYQSNLTPNGPLYTRLQFID